MVAPNAGKSIFAGQGAVIDTGADMEPITAPGSSSSSSWARPARDKAAGRASSAHVLFRNALREAAELRRYAAPVVAVSGQLSRRARAARSSAIPTNRAVYGADARRSEDVLLTRFDAAALVPVLQGRQYLLVHVERASDILQVHRAQARIPVAEDGAGRRERRLDWSPTDRALGHSGDCLGGQRPARRRSSRSPRPSRTSAGCARAGVKVSIGMIDDNDTRNLFDERQYAGNLVGLAEDARRDRASAGARRWR